MATNPNLLIVPIAENGNKNTLPENQGTSGQMSQSTGFPPETSLPLGAGGVAPSREDFNGAFNLLGGVAFYAQKGWIFQWDATQDYYAGCVVRDTNDGNMYECINDVSAGGSNPAADSTNWKPFGGAGMLYLRESSKAYAVGDIAYNANLPSYMHLLCTTAGTTDSTEPDFTGAAIGGTVSDGTVVWTYSTNYDLERDFTIIYPNGGTEANPANITKNTRYVESNPFSGYRVNCKLEVKKNNEWGSPGWIRSGSDAYGAVAGQLDDGSIIVQVASVYVVGETSAKEGTLWGDTSNPYEQSLPARVKVWKIGKVANS